MGYGDANPLQIFVPYDGIAAHTLRQIEVGTLPWWASSHLHLAFLRYTSTLTMLLDYQLWPDRPELMHLHSLLWLSALVAAVALFYRRILGATWIAGLAALLYAVDDAHAWPATYLANRNALIATCLGVLSLVSFARWRQNAGRWSRALSAMLLALALSAGEMALATAAYLLSYALTLDNGTIQQKLARLFPHAVVLGGWALVYRVGDFGSHGSGFYLDPLRNPLSYAAGFLERAPLLLLGQWTPIPAELGLVFAPGTTEAFALRVVSWAVVAALAGLLIPIMMRDRVARFWGLGVLLSLLPIAAVGPENRVLFFVGLGSMGVLAQLVQTAFAARSAVSHSRGWRLFARAAVIILLPVHLLVAPWLGLVWIGLQAKASAAMLRAIDSVPNDPQIAMQDLVLVNPPDHIYVVTAIPVLKELNHLPAPRRLRALSAGTSALEVTRIGPRSLRVRFPQGLFPTVFSRYMRGDDDPFDIGQRFELADFSVEVQSLNARGDPDEVVYQFAVPLEDSSLRWMRWQDGVYVPWLPPTLGESVQLLPSRGIFG
ncbi:MAG TPA: hypothetical protein VL403_07095 [Candidatus Kryptonia bacterium]|nr:hypothetical protein [Candidatus Kryptonia bacterium]